MMACAPADHDQGTLIAAGLTPPEAEGMVGERVVEITHFSTLSVCAQRKFGNSGRPTLISPKQKLSCQDRKCCYLGFIKFSLAVLGFADTVFITGNISSFGAASALPLPSPFLSS